jgi:hypothetical protein
MDEDCQRCSDGLEHCHGTAISHARFGPECTESDCQTPDVTHAFSIDCEAIGCACAVIASKPQPIGSAV